MDLLGDLVGGQSCASDGTAASRNPISRLVDSLMEGSAGQHQKGRTRRAFSHGGDQGGTMVRHRTGVEPSAFTSSAAVDAAEARGMQGGNMPLGPGGGTGLNASHHAAAFQQVQLSYVRTPVGGLPPVCHRVSSFSYECEGFQCQASCTLAGGASANTVVSVYGRYGVRQSRFIADSPVGTYTT